MGMYTEFTFKGVIKEEFVEDIRAICDKEVDESGFKTGWDNVKSSIWDNYKKLERYDSIPYFNNCKRTVNEFDEETRTWSFECNFLNYWGQIRAFLELVPLFTEELIECEDRYEEFDTPNIYELKNGRLIKVAQATNDYYYYYR